MVAILVVLVLALKRERTYIGVPGFGTGYGECTTVT